MRRLLFPLFALLLLGACRVHVEVDVTVERDGTGEVAVTANLDEDAVSELEEVDGSLRTDDLEDAGWSVAEPVDVAEGGSSITIRRRFQSVGEAEDILGSLSPAASFSVDQQRTFLRTRTEVAGAVDLRAGLASFGDPQLTESFGGTELGVPPEALEEHLGEPVAEIFSLGIETRVPGRRSVVDIGLGEQERLLVRSNPVNRTTIALLVVAVGAAAAAVTTFLVVRRRH